MRAQCTRQVMPGGWGRGRARRASWEKCELRLGRWTGGGGLRGTEQGECKPHARPVPTAWLCPRHEHRARAWKKTCSLHVCRNLSAPTLYPQRQQLPLKLAPSL